MNRTLHDGGVDHSGNGEVNSEHGRTVQLRAEFDARQRSTQQLPVALRFQFRSFSWSQVGGIFGNVAESETTLRWPMNDAALICIAIVGTYVPASRRGCDQQLARGSSHGS